MEKDGGAAPTGCYKCGRPGHWSRDCNISTVADPTNPNNTSRIPYQSGAPKPDQKSGSEKPKKPPRTRPKLTPELLLSNDGLGYVLRHFPRSFKYRGRGHEVSDLGNLIGLYTQWHSHLLPYYSFDQFVQKVEQVGATKRVRTCIRELRERVANGGDPTKLHEPPVEHVAPDCEPEEGMEGSVPTVDDPPVDGHDADDIQEQMFNEIYNRATEEPRQSSQTEMVAAVVPDQTWVEEPPNQVAQNKECNSSKIQVTEEQKARMEANRLKALEKIAARSRSLQSS
ncbi:zinc knuckle (CCHC-type) family protein isoform X2 [Tasmannia lanceolata]|uniref:zinc knuckle (CCHC-type) family protein isoform X2 n=1 Tax=Tasmannia lanceolata TaxID=3420 RepID=UPI00406382C0